MTADDHPTYPNPTIVEAVCQVDFELAAGSSWRIARPAEFLRLISTEYPNIEPVPGVGFTVAVGQGPVPQMVQQSSALKLSPDAKGRYIAVGDRHFAFGYGAPYPGWETFRGCLLDGWAKFVQVAKVERMSRASLRYVNIIPRTADHPLISDWLRPTDIVPKALIGSQRDPCVLRVESWIDQNSLLIVTIGIAVSSTPVPSVLLDIQQTSTVSVAANPDDLISHIDTLHNHVWQQFASIKTPRLDAYLEGRTG